VHIVRSVNADGERRWFDPARDFPALVQAAARLPELRLMIVDPIVSAIAGDSHKNSETRRGLQPLVEFAERVGCALYGVTHFSKASSARDPIERVTGSIAFAAVARIIMATAKLPEAEGGGRVFVRSKSNIGPDGGGFRYDLRQGELEGEYSDIIASRVEWGGTIEGTAREILATAEADTDPSERNERAEAAEWLRAALVEAGGEMLKADVIRAADRAGYKERTVHRARSAAGACAVVTGFGKDKRSVWRLVEGPSVPSNHAIHATQNVGTNGTNGGMDAGLARDTEVFR
jgi:putative DNA primase/helicase